MFGDKLKKVINENKEPDGNNKKKIENLVFFVIILIVTIIAINIIWNGNKNATKVENNVATKQLANTSSSNDTTLSDNDINYSELEQKLEDILSKIQGVGSVKVLINYSESSEVVAMYNETSKNSTTEESDTSGGTRKIEEVDNQKDIIFQEDDGNKVPITQKVVQPKVEGAIITAKGAGNATVKSNIIQAVEAVTGIPTHKIQVFEMN